MTCFPIRTSTVTGMVCTGRQRRAKCATPDCPGKVDVLCDYPVTRKGKRTTCSAKLCERCRVKKGETDYCPPHARLAGITPMEPRRGDHRIHVETGRSLWVVRIDDDPQTKERLLTFARQAPDRDGHFCGVLQTVPLEKWRAKTRVAAGTTGTCRGCSARMEWVKSADGKNVPLDPEPHPDGNIVIDDEGVALYAERGSFPVMYLSHFATCPRADEFRRKR